MCMANLNDKLHKAALCGDHYTVQSTLDRGADINAKTSIGSTALMDAAINNNVGVVKMLLSRGADINVINYAGDTAGKIADKWGHKEVAELIDTAEERSFKDVEGPGWLSRMYDKDDNIEELMRCRYESAASLSKDWVRRYWDDQVSYSKQQEPYKWEPLHVPDEDTTSEGLFKKFDNNKLKLSLLPFESLEEVTKVLMHGAEKYGAENWKECEDVSRYEDALLRHLSSYMKGEEADEDTELSHIAHAACNALFLLWFELQEDRGLSKLVNERDVE